jgi:flagellar protein FliS
MNHNHTDLSYRKAAIEGASPIGLVIALYDTLAGNLRRAASAVRNNDIEARCKELNHAALVLGQLESWIDFENGGDLAKSLFTFYAYLRARMLEGSIKQSSAMFEEQMDLVLQVRSSWQIRDASAPPESESPRQISKTGLSPDLSPVVERMAFSMSA